MIRLEHDSSYGNGFYDYLFGYWNAEQNSNCNLHYVILLEGVPTANQMKYCKYYDYETVQVTESIQKIFIRMNKTESVK